MNAFDWVVLSVIATIGVGYGLLWLFAKGMSDKVD